MKKAALRAIIIAILLLAAGVLAEAQQPKKVFRVGYLGSGNPTTESARSEGIRQRLRELGYIEGQNLIIEYRYADGRRDRHPELIGDLIRLKVDIILVAGADSVIQAAKNATKTIPIVMVGTGTDPVEAGFIKSLARPGGNITGITNLGAQLGGKRLELLKEAVGKVSHVAVLHDPDNPSHVRELKEDLPPPARALKLTLQHWEVRGAEDIDKVFVEKRKQRPDGLYILGGPLMRDNQKQLVGSALKSRLPSMFFTRAAVDDGGLMSYGADVADSYRQVAWYVDRILTGTKPEALPVQQPMKFEFVINLQTAKKIGVTINTDVLARATKIIR